MPDVALFTYKDATDHAIDVTAGAGTGADAKAARRAAHEALRDLANIRDWCVYLMPGRVTTVASYGTGTIAYTNSSRVVTLTSGTWPSWAAYGVLVIGSVRYTVASRTSDSVIVLAADSNPGEDVAAGTEYTLYRDSYPVPADFKKIITPLYDCTSKRFLSHEDPLDAMQSSRWLNTTGEPWAFTIQGDSNYQGGTAFSFVAAPSSARNYDYLYRRNPRPLRFENEATGTISVAGTTAVTGSGTAFTEAMVGSVIRISSTTDAPTGLYGSNPYAEERVVTGYTSAASLTVDTAWTQTLSGKKYVLSDPVDIDLPVMLNAYTTGIAARLGHLRSKDDRAPLEAMYQEELRRAACADQKNGAPRGVEDAVVRSFAQMRARYGTVT